MKFRFDNTIGSDIITKINSLPNHCLYFALNSNTPTNGGPSRWGTYWILKHNNAACGINFDYYANDFGYFYLRNIDTATSIKWFLINSTEITN